MRLLLIIMAVAAVSATGSELHGTLERVTLPSTDDVLDTNAFNASYLYNEAFPIYGNFWTADDFTAGATVEVEKITIWVVTTASTPTEVDVSFWDDAAPGPGTELDSWTVDGSDLVLTSTGIMFSGYPVHTLEATLPGGSFFFAFEGATYWIAVQRTSGGDLLALMDNQVRGAECYRVTSSGGPWVPGSTLGNPATDMFRIVEGSAASVFHQSTWGAVKTLF